MIRRLALSAALAVVTMLLIGVLVAFAVTYWALISTQGWSMPISFAVFAVPFVLLLTAAFAWQEHDQ